MVEGSGSEAGTAVGWARRGRRWRGRNGCGGGGCSADAGSRSRRICMRLTTRGRDFQRQHLFKCSRVLCFSNLFKRPGFSTSTNAACTRPSIAPGSFPNQVLLLPSFPTRPPAPQTPSSVTRAPLRQPRCISGQTGSHTPGLPHPSRAITLSIKVLLSSVCQRVLACAPRLLLLRHPTTLAVAQSGFLPITTCVALYYYHTTSSLYPPLPPPCPSAVVTVLRPRPSCQKHRPASQLNARHHHHPASPLGVRCSQGHRASHARRERALAP
ncbi:hypothetical protein K466DRAFT_367660 [Polyporus arcularius HHB13444]|uniref:Uncharacterized protein n=1 Tax=Polyporus arcularius HHB13444 TaxID=1314778 RepID=A0A5C3PNY0_9APHY|nr:hypothetical protein K466DRAFT_367660 [Polyporus arcularius HHB13444]